MTINYGSNEDWRWDLDTEEVRFVVYDDGTEILCRVTRECLEDHCGNPQDEDTCLTAAKENFDRITDQIGFYVKFGRFDPDGSVLLRTRDWRGQ